MSHKLSCEWKDDGHLLVKLPPASEEGKILVREFWVYDANRDVLAVPVDPESVEARQGLTKDEIPDYIRRRWLNMEFGNGYAFPKNQNFEIEFA